MSMACGACMTKEKLIESVNNMAPVTGTGQVIFNTLHIVQIQYSVPV
jgi:hypothetical protein